MRISDWSSDVCSSDLRGDRRDTHLRDDLVQTLVDRLAIRLRELLGRLVLDLTGADHFIQRRVGKVRIDRRRAVTDQACELMRIARSRGLDDDVAGAAPASVSEAVVDRPAGAERKSGSEGKSVAESVAIWRA